MANYEEARVKLTKTQLSKLKSAAKNNNGTTLRITKKKVQDEDFPHELFFTTRQKTRKRNAFANNMLANIKLSKSLLSKTIESGRFLGKTLGNLDKKVLLDLAVSLVKDVMPKLATKATSYLLNKFEREINERGAERTGKIFTLFISNEDMGDII